ncbi:hypothetical protein P879_10984 [Paragonimus westermani]|uniref:Multidrug resistance protein, MATE family n=1 Tax=Paragonimus westermani TaxID=34504 RepID=A0A8T0D1K6_9TREM|nr:hypothetical protein P879_10984 [Paragonimus westermani]
MSGIISAIFCGQLSKSALATVGLALAYFNITGLMIIFGLLTAAETLFTQTFGSEKKYLMGTQLQRALVISTFCTVLCASANFLAEPVFLLLKQNPLTAKEAAKFLLYMIPGLWFAAFGQVFTKYVQSQNHQYPPMIIGIIVNGLNAALHYWLLFVAQIGVRGSAIAQVVMYAFQSLILLGYTIFLERNSVTWQGLSWDLWMEWGTWFRLAIPGVFMLTMEFLIFEIGSFGAGALGETELAVQTILFNVETVCYALLPQGFGMATTIRLGQFLGAGSSAGPRSVLSTALVTMWVAALVVTSLLILLRRQIPLIFTTNR